MKRIRDELTTGERPEMPADVSDNHAGEDAAVRALVEADAATSDVAADPKNTPIAKTASVPSPQSVVSGTPELGEKSDAPRASDDKKRGRPLGSGRSLTGKQYKGLAKDQLTALIADRDDSIRDLKAQLDTKARELQTALPVAADQLRDLESLSGEVFQTASGIAVLVFRDGRWALNPAQLGRLKTAAARVLVKRMPTIAEQSPEWALVLALGGVISEKMLELPQPLDAPAESAAADPAPALRLEKSAAVNK